MILTINMPPETALPRLYDAFEGLTRLLMDARDNVDNPETKAARELIVSNAMRLLGAEPDTAPDSVEKHKLSPREFVLALLDFLRPIMRDDPVRTMRALHGLYDLGEGEKDSAPKALSALVATLMQPDVLDFTRSLGELAKTDFGL